jgi:Fe2+ or Zn2+ uptake regulation protein/O6-methylguanine-DNA--protein-cysteine methyltransferase
VLDWDAPRLLGEHGLRATRQRLAILEAFGREEPEHLSAEEVLARARSMVPEIGRGTVYAGLTELAQAGLLASVGEPEAVRYEKNLEPHDHFRCRLCRRLFDVEFAGDALARRSLKGYEVESVIVRVEGVCAQCVEYERGLEDGAGWVLERPLIASDAMSELYCVLVSSPVGKLAIAASVQGVARIAFEEHADFDALRERARTRRGPGRARELAGKTSTFLERYFAGSRRTGSAPIDWRLSTEQNARTLRAAQAIPYAGDRSYERVIPEIPAYDAGFTFGSNPTPFLIPCHRIGLGATRPGAYVGGTDRRDFLRDLEAG